MRPLALLFAACLALAACSSEDEKTCASLDCAPLPAKICTPGATQVCTGPGACAGGQSCLSDGTGYGACACGGGQGGAAGASGAGGQSGGVGAGGAMCIGSAEGCDPMGTPCCDGYKCGSDKSCVKQ